MECMRVLNILKGWVGALCEWESKKLIVWEANFVIKQERVEAYRSIKSYNCEREKRNTNWANCNKERQNEAKINGL